MAYKEIAKYALTYQNRPIIWVQLVGENRMQATNVTAGDAVFVADMLRFEKPLFYDPDTKIFSTAPEEVGEEES